MLSAVKALSLTTLLLVVVVNGNAPTPPPGATTGATTGATAVLRAAVARHDCRSDGFGDGFDDRSRHGSGDRHQVPMSALVRTPRGAVRRVGPEVGWAVHTGRRPGTLVAVCHDAPPRPLWVTER